MITLSRLGIGLCVVFSLLFLALVAEIYYLLCWKKRTTSTTKDDDDGRITELIKYFCFRNAPTSSSIAVNPLEISGTGEQATGDSVIKPVAGEEGIEAELIRLHNLAGFPRLLFTIKEETKEDMESDDGRSRGDQSRKGSRRLSDILFHGDTPLVTPRSSPSVTPINNYSYNHNPLFESKTSVNWPRASPPPKFKFLRDAEEKLYRKTLMEETMKVHRRAYVNSELMDSKEEDDSSVKIVIEQQQPNASSPQVTPLHSSPSPTSDSDGDGDGVSTIGKNYKE